MRLLIRLLLLMAVASGVANAQTWVKVANENDTVKATATVRYGAVACTPTATVPCWIQLAVSGSFTVNNAFFKADPDPNVVKELDVLETTAAQTVTVNGKPVTVPALTPPPVVTPPVTPPPVNSVTMNLSNFFLTIGGVTYTINAGCSAVPTVQ